MGCVGADLDYGVDRPKAIPCVERSQESKAGGHQPEGSGCGDGKRQGEGAEDEAFENREPEYEFADHHGLLVGRCAKR